MAQYVRSGGRLKVQVRGRQQLRQELRRSVVANYAAQLLQQLTLPCRHRAGMRGALMAVKAKKCLESGDFKIGAHAAPAQPTGLRLRRHWQPTCQWRR
jgi:hypothetical protein